MHTVEMAVRQGMERVIAPDSLVTEDMADALATAIARAVMEVTR